MKKAVILGCPRSGTTLLAKLMEDHLRLAAPIEPHFIEYFLSYRCLFPGTLSEKRIEILLKSIKRFLLIWLPRNNPAQDIEAIEPHSLLFSMPEKIEEAEGPIRFNDVLTDVMNAYSQSKHKEGWVDKSAYFFPPNTPGYATVSGDIKFIHIVRDGRDVCSSWRLSWFAPPTVWLAARLWRQQVKQASAWCASNPERAIEITYEELTETPNRLIKKIGKFLNIEPELNPNTANAMARTLSQGGSHKDLSGAILKNSGKWQKNLSEDEIKIFTLVAAETLEQKGYKNIKEYRSQFLLFPHIKGWLSYLHPTVAKRRVKRLIPLYCIIMETILYLWGG